MRDYLTLCGCSWSFLPRRSWDTVWFLCGGVLTLLEQLQNAMHRFLNCLRGIQLAILVQEDLLQMHYGKLMLTTVPAKHLGVPEGSDKCMAHLIKRFRASMMAMSLQRRSANTTYPKSTQVMTVCGLASMPSLRLRPRLPDSTCTD